MKNIGSTFIIFFFLVGFMGTSATVEPSSNPKDNSVKSPPSLTEEITFQFRDVVTDYFHKAQIPGLAAAVVNDREILWTTTLGVLAKDSSNQVDDHSLFSIQSMTKSFTAMGVLLAIQEGWLDLDTPISEYLPDFRINSRFEENPEKIITLRHLLSHRSGIVHNAPFGNNTDLEYDFERHIQSLSDSWLLFPVGYCYSYSNSGIDLAGYILQKKSGQAFPQYLEEKVLKPLGMTESSADFDVIEKRSNRTKGVWRSTDPIPLRISMVPAGGLYSNIWDMSKYLKFHINKGKIEGKQFLRKDLMDEFHSIQFQGQDQKFGAALGLVRNDIIKPYGVWHAGGGHGFFSWMGIYPDLKLGVVLLTNSQALNFSADNFRFIDEIIMKHHDPNMNTPPSREDMTALENKDQRVRYRIGRYGPRSPEIGYQDEELRITIFGQAYPLEFFEYRGKMIGLFGDNMAVKFLPDLGGERGAMMVYSLVLGDSHRRYYFFNDSPSDRPGPDKPEWDKYLGEYESVYHGRRLFTGTVHRRNGHLYWGEQKLLEYKKGLFFVYDGWEVDFNEDPPRIGHYRIRPVKDGGKDSRIR